jgi:hypothetical protein
MRKFFVAAALAVVAMFGAGSNADAAFKVRISTDNGGTFTEVFDGQTTGTYTDGASATGAITFLYSDSTVMFSVLVGQSKPLFGNSPHLSAMDIAVVGTFKTAGSVIVDITDTDFIAPTSPAGFGRLTAEIGSAAPSGTTFDSYLQGGAGGNLEYGGIDSNSGTIIEATGASAPGTLIVFKDGTALSPYSLTARTKFSGTVNSGFSIDNKVTFAVPAPAGLVLAMAAAPMFGFGAWIRRRRASISA